MVDPIVVLEETPDGIVLPLSRSKLDLADVVVTWVATLHLTSAAYALVLVELTRRIDVGVEEYLCLCIGILA